MNLDFVRLHQRIREQLGAHLLDLRACLGFAVTQARVGKVVDLELDAADETEARAQVEKMCAELLANPLMESYEVEIHG